MTSMVRSYNYPLLPTKEQSRTMHSWLEVCRNLYNAALDGRRDAYRKQGVTRSLYEQQVELTELRKADPEFKAVPAVVLRSALTRIDYGYKMFFKRIKAKSGKPGFPRHKSQQRYNSFSFPAPIEFIDGNYLLIPKLGAVKVHLYRPIPCHNSLQMVHIRRKGGKWFLSIVADLGEVPAKTPPQSFTGVDVGLQSLAVLADGDRIENPRFLKAAEGLIAKHQHRLSKKAWGSSSRQHAKQVLSRAYTRLQNRRLDFARKLACLLFSRFDMIAFEDFNIDKLAKGYLEKAIRDAAWSLLLRCLRSKAEEAGKYSIEVNAWGTTSECSACGEKVPKDITVREHRCPHCGLVLDRDHNAAINIMVRGLHTLKAA